MNLNLILPLKKVTINNKELCIRKLGLKHHKLLRDAKSPEETLKIVLDEINTDLTRSEAKLVLYHVLEFNGKIKKTFEYKGQTYSIDDIYILPRPEFTYQGKTYTFKEPSIDQRFFSAKDILETLCTEEVDFGNMPAFVYKWADELNKSIAIKLSDKIVYGDDIEELFNGDE
ncbi:TPA: hypothetical protein ACOA2N_003421 [Vibrio cholerae]|nr:baseplate hub [Providencia phage PSTRCR_127]QQV89052.1 baseplate hub [Providencia phage PSTRCR_121]UGO50225.1 putative baseplate hub distal subunit [Morganella phage vB_MmoM_Rgz1]